MNTSESSLRRNIFPAKLVAHLTPQPLLLDWLDWGNPDRPNPPSCLIYAAPCHLQMEDVLDALPDMPGGPARTAGFGSLNQERDGPGKRSIEVKLVVVAVDGNDPRQVLGMVNLSASYLVAREPDRNVICVNFEGICVAEGHRKLGLGRQLALSSGSYLADAMCHFLSAFPGTKNEICLYADFNSEGGEATYYALSNVLRVVAKEFRANYVEDCGY